MGQIQCRTPNTLPTDFLSFPVGYLAFLFTVQSCQAMFLKDQGKLLQDAEPMYRYTLEGYDRALGPPSTPFTAWLTRAICRMPSSCTGEHWRGGRVLWVATTPPPSLPLAALASS